MSRSLWTAAFALACMFPGAAQAENRAVLLGGDIVTGLAPMVAFGTAWWKDDKQGEIEWVRCTAISELLNVGLRYTFDRTTHLGRRPDGHPYGFPSGHAGFMFSQAGFMEERYGWHWGAPMLAAATAVSAIRVQEGKHYWRDVIVGGGVSYGVALLTVTPENATHLGAVVGPDWLGIRFERSF
jgi:membrane-associated phospholipid phosphatase